MGWLTTQRALAPSALIVLSGCAMAAAPADWRTWDLGAFRLQTPAEMQHVAGGIDSKAGTLASDGLRVQYDFGLYSDPLNPRGAVSDYRSGAGKVDGLPARFVQFRSSGQAGQPQTCSGVHVAGVRPSSMGMLSLTVLACAATSDQLAPATAILASIRFQAPASR